MNFMKQAAVAAAVLLTAGVLCGAGDSGTRTDAHNAAKPTAKKRLLSKAEMQRIAEASPPTKEQIAALGDVHAQASRHVTASTSGGRLEATVDWSGSGPYNGRVYGSVTDTKADGYCAFARIWKDGNIDTISGNACPKGDTKFVNGTFRNQWRVLVSVCAAECSDWK
ncbi:hypothetical protein [Streptomyces sp. NPDC048665]|uniref:hypothetical protein n=1 Tax=Streptomyces sp. NPDC048665 TaxID=3155490 RepID=UPI003436C098